MTAGPTTRTGAVLFTDLVGFTEFTASVGDAAALAVLDVQSAIVDAVLSARGGRVVKELGDGLLVWFEDPHEAVVTAWELMREVELARARGAFPLSVRMAVHAGEVVERGHDVVGHTVNVAARIVEVAGPGELLASEDALAAAGAVPARFAPIGPARVKGVAEPIWLHRSLGQPGA
jgi:class 3 adenylate cyclase